MALFGQGHLESYKENQVVNPASVPTPTQSSISSLPCDPGSDRTAHEEAARSGSPHAAGVSSSCPELAAPAFHTSKLSSGFRQLLVI